MARLIRTRYEVETRAGQFCRDVQWWHAEFKRVEAESNERREAMEALVATRRWQVAGAVGRPLDVARRLARRR